MFLYNIIILSIFLILFSNIDSQIKLDFKRKWSGDFRTEKNILSNY